MADRGWAVCIGKYDSTLGEFFKIWSFNKPITAKAGEIRVMFIRHKDQNIAGFGLLFP